jgi:hypothetical protein
MATCVSESKEPVIYEIVCIAFEVGKYIPVEMLKDKSAHTEMGQVVKTETCMAEKGKGGSILT